MISELGLTFTLNLISISSSYNLLDAIYTEISSTMKPIHSLGSFGAKLITLRPISMTVVKWLTRSPTNLKVAGSSLPTDFIFFNGFL